MRLAMRIGARSIRLAMSIAFAGRPFYAHSRGVEGVAPEGRVRGARKVDAFSVVFFSLPRGKGQAGLRASASVAVRLGRVRGSVRIEEHLATRPASRWAHSDEPCSSPRLDEVRDFNRRRAQHMIRRRSQLRKHLTE